MKCLQVTISTTAVCDWSLQNLVSVFSFSCVSEVMHLTSVKTTYVLQFCDSRGQCFVWLVNLTVVAVYSLFSYFWCSTVDSIQFRVACCTAVSCRWRYVTDISLVQLLLRSGPKRLPANTQNMCVRNRCVVLPDFYSTLWLEFWRHDGVYNSLL